MGNPEVAKTILAQLGGSMFIRMTGASNLAGEPTALWFSLPGARGFCKGAINRVEVRLMPNDTYTLRFWRLRKGKEPVQVSFAEDVYFDNLRAVFREHTGLETRMPVVKGLS